MPSRMPELRIRTSTTIPMIQRVLLCPLLCLSTILGTAQVPILLRDINPDGDSDADDMTCFGDRIFFTADDGEHGTELWVSDGSSDGTYMLKDINLGSGSGTVGPFVPLGDHIYFAADDGVNGGQLWRSDGTEAGTVPFLDIENTTGLTSGDQFTFFEDKIYFRGGTDAEGRELWVTDGTVDGTHLLKDINAGIPESSPNDFAAFGDKLYFAAKTVDDGEELWATDGTEEGTVQVMDIRPGTGSSSPGDLVAASDLLFFAANDGTIDPELWATDGTEAGTYNVRDIRPSGGSYPVDLAEYNGRVWFTANDGSDPQLWSSDGTEAGTQLFEATTPLTYPSDMSAHNGRLYFIAFGTNNGQLWSTDGTAAGTMEHLYPGSTVGSPLFSTHLLAGCGNFLFYLAQYDLATGNEPHTLDTPTGLAEEAPGTHALLYPTPASDHLEMQSVPAKAILTLYTLEGRMLLQTPARANMDIRVVPDGLYLARITAADGKILLNQRIVVQR